MLFVKSGDFQRAVLNELSYWVHLLENLTRSFRILADYPTNDFLLRDGCGSFAGHNKSDSIFANIEPTTIPRNYINFKGEFFLFVDRCLRDALPGKDMMKLRIVLLFLLRWLFPIPVVLMKLVCALYVAAGNPRTVPASEKTLLRRWWVFSIFQYMDYFRHRLYFRNRYMHSHIVDKFENRSLLILCTIDGLEHNRDRPSLVINANWDVRENIMSTH